MFDNDIHNECRIVVLTESHSKKRYEHFNWRVKWFRNFIFETKPHDIWLRNYRLSAPNLVYLTPLPLQIGSGGIYSGFNDLIFKPYVAVNYHIFEMTLEQFINLFSKATKTTTFNSMWHSDAVWRHESGSTLTLVMACCLTAQHNTSTDVDLSSKFFFFMWHLSESDFTKGAHKLNL